MAAKTCEAYRIVSIDFQVHKELTVRLQSPADTDNEVIRRLLQIPDNREEKRSVVASSTAAHESTVSVSARPAWRPNGVIFPHGTEFRRRYKGQLFSARVLDGKLVYNAQQYDSPSPAAMAITGNSVNGWIWWECRLPGQSRWERIDSVR